MTWWIVKGPPENWKHSLTQGNIWGVASRHEKLWSQIKDEDKVLFYATAPVKGVFGHGVVRSTFKDEQPFFPDEVKGNKALWNLRFTFDIIFYLPQEQWETKAVKVPPGQTALQRGLQRVKEDVAEELIKALESK